MFPKKFSTFSLPFFPFFSGVFFLIEKKRKSRSDRAIVLSMFFFLFQLSLNFFRFFPHSLSVLAGEVGEKENIKYKKKKKKKHPRLEQSYSPPNMYRSEQSLLFRHTTTSANTHALYHGYHLPAIHTESVMIATLTRSSR